MKTKALKSLSTIIGIWIAAVSLLSGLSITAFAEELPSKVKFTLTVTDENGEPDPITYVYFRHPYVYTSEVGTTKSSSREQSLRVTAVAGTSGKYTFEGTLSEKINSLSGGTLSCSVNFYSNKLKRYVYSQSVAYIDENSVMEFKINVDDASTMTPGWDEGRIYSQSKPYYGSVAYVKPGDSYMGMTILYAGGGKLNTAGGGFNDTKTEQLTLIETFNGEYCNTTESKEIKWIVTKDKVCPTSFSQKSDASVCRVSKGKVTAVAAGMAYVWACRVDPGDPKKVSVNESACVGVYVSEAPKKLVLRMSRDEEAPAVTKVDMNIGETVTAYIGFEGKGTGSIDKNYTYTVTKGSEYIAVSDAYDYFTVTALPTVLEKNKTVKATIQIQSKYSKAKAKLNITIGNGVVAVGKAETLQITSSADAQTLTIDADTIKGYITTSGKRYFTEDETISAMETTDKPSVFATSASAVNDEMVYKTSKNGDISIKFSGAKSSAVSASYKNGAVTVKVKKNAATENGNIIIVFNTKKYLVIPFTIS